MSHKQLVINSQVSISNRRSFIKERKALKVERRKARAKMMYKLLNNMCPQSLPNLFTYKSEMTSYNLRNVSCTLCLPQRQTNNLNKSFMNDGSSFETIAAHIDS